MKEILEWNQFRFKTKYTLHPFPNTSMPPKMQFHKEHKRMRVGQLGVNLSISINHILALI